LNGPLATWLHGCCLAILTDNQLAVADKQGRTYLCKRLDLDHRLAVVRPANLKYYTRPRDFTDVFVVGGHRAAYPAEVTSICMQRCGGEGHGLCSAHLERGNVLQQRMETLHRPAAADVPCLCRCQALSRFPSTTATCSECEVTTRWMGFHRIWHGSGQVFDTVDLFLPDVQFPTQVRYQ